jgi:CubicO group peptidase (beta-lactamase class C family)
MKITTLLLALSFCACCAEETHRVSPPEAQRLAALPSRFQELVDHNQLAGAVLLVEQHGEVALLKGVGYQNLEQRTPMRTDSIFQIMSMTKPITAAGLMTLVEEGKIILTDPVEKYLPEFHDQPPPPEISVPPAAPGITRRGPRPMTVWNLLTHTNGMTDPPADQRKLIQFDMGLSLADAVRLYATQARRFEPGTRWAYSNEGLATAGRIIEVVSGEPYEKFIDERILKPLGMKDSFYFPDAARIPRIAMLYRADNGRLVPPGANVLGGDPTLYRKGAKYPAPEYGLYSTATDLAAFYEMMLNGGTYRGKRILSRSTVDAMTTLQTGAFDTANRGFGNGLAFMVPKDSEATLDLLGPGVFGHNGAFGTWVFADRNKDLIGAVLIQLSGNNQFVQHLFSGMVESAVDREP